MPIVTTTQTLSCPCCSPCGCPALPAAWDVTISGAGNLGGGSCSPACSPLLSQIQCLNWNTTTTITADAGIQCSFSNLNNRLSLNSVACNTGLLSNYYGFILLGYNILLAESQLLTGWYMVLQGVNCGGNFGSVFKLTGGPFNCLGPNTFAFDPAYAPTSPDLCDMTGASVYITPH